MPRNTSLNLFARSLLCCVLASAIIGCGAAAAADKADKTPAAVLTVTTAVAKTSQVARTISVNGTVFAWQEVIVGPEVGGYRVTAVNVDVGDHVKRGQELVRLQSSLLEVDVDSKRAALKQAQAQWVNAQAAFRRADSLSSSGVFTQADLDRLRSEELAAAGRAESAEADLKTAQLRLQYTHVTAPDDGIVTTRMVTVGQIAQAGGEMLRLLRQGRLEWRGDVPESRLKDVRAGQLVSISTAGGDTLKGKVRVVAPTVQNANRTGTVYVDILDRGPGRPGMFARGEIELSHSAVTLVPLVSIVMQDGYSYLFIMTGNKTVQRRRVETGTVRGSDIEVDSGLKAGETVVAKGAGFLKDGDRVNVGVQL